MNEADTCRTLVRPKLESSGWDGDKHFYSEQTAFTDGRIVVPAGKPRRLKKKFSDFLLRYTRDITLAVVEAKSDKVPAGNGLQQAKDYATILGLKFAYATNGKDIIEYDDFTKLETVVEQFPTPEELWGRYLQGQGLTKTAAATRLTPDYYNPKKVPRYYQRIAIDRAVEAILKGQKRCLLTLATGTGKTTVAFQICWKLWSAGWNASNDPTRKTRILFLADRNVLVDDPKDKDFAPFAKARMKIEGEAIKSREMYFAIYQAIAKDSGYGGKACEGSAVPVVALDARRIKRHETVAGFTVLEPSCLIRLKLRILVSSQLFPVGGCHAWAVSGKLATSCHRDNSGRCLNSAKNAAK